MVVPLLGDCLAYTTLGRRILRDQAVGSQEEIYLIEHQTDTEESSMDGHGHANLR
jgi:hypothetical protein